MGISTQPWGAPVLRITVGSNSIHYLCTIWNAFIHGIKWFVRITIAIAKHLPVCVIKAILQHLFTSYIQQPNVLNYRFLSLYFSSYFGSRWVTL